MSVPMWRLWGSSRYGVSRLPRFWIALLACALTGHRWNMHSNAFGTKVRACTRCWHREVHKAETDS